MIQPEPVERDKWGFWLHPALHDLEEDSAIDDHPSAEGMELRYVEFFTDAPESLRQMYEDGCAFSNEVTWESAVKAWQPTAPEGEGWFPLAIYDTEDGPYACFARPSQPTGA